MSAVIIMNGATVWTLTTFDEPYTKGDGVYIAPRALDAVMIRLQSTYPEADWGPCESLANP